MSINKQNENLDRLFMAPLFESEPSEKGVVAICNFCHQEIYGYEDSFYSEEKDKTFCLDCKSDFLDLFLIRGE